MTYLFIINPVAGKHNSEATISIIKEKMKKHGLKHEIKITSRVGEAKQLAKDAISSHIDTIVAVGGDGTIHEVLNGMVNSNKNLGIIPAGTGNDLARTLGLPLDIEESLDKIIEGKIKKIDIGCFNEEYFINFASVGLDALIASEANKIKKLIASKYAYILSVILSLTRFKSPKLKIRIDDLYMEKDIMLVAICNGAYYGGGMKIAPKADLQDGCFDICIVNKMNKLKLLWLFPSIFKGNHIKYKDVEMFKGRKVEIDYEGYIEVNTDGEIKNARPVCLEIMNKKIRTIGI
ncbi:diacylglycerol kinase family lipid kinase [Serpentinicella sp. ANB-PHB4]|uniref:diacylglycerol/lipid kinase family protein n=1 Tax=Serpentinicella sp. ANB-PHB4 TaxID=3074076 RepID=UPI00285DBBE2|nr:diacylglycerol kinase family lipid kinase [Serpentinicella sp. ANB-PHB4]MDR5658897.1 diacylglycerol kinase family lipid kinase [Serpentinicella sp. ANB-PHB4]